MEARTVDPLGRAVRSFYDDLGNRVRAELPDGSAWGVRIRSHLPG
ncbi:hypothetical protein [Microlunatus sp. Gsoil 973]|nr:hypothetical protein [Microlunatus sp. Gsoil 973]